MSRSAPDSVWRGESTELECGEGVERTTRSGALGTLYPGGHHAENGARVPSGSGSGNPEVLSPLTAAAPCDRVERQGLGASWVASLSRQRVVRLSAVCGVGGFGRPSSQDRESAPGPGSTAPAATPTRGRAPHVAGRNIEIEGDRCHESTRRSWVRAPTQDRALMEGEDRGWGV